MTLVHSRKLLTTLKERAAPSHTALLVVDMQNDYVSESGASHKRHGSVSAVRAIVPPLQKLLDSARQTDALLVYIQMTFDAQLRLLSDVDYVRRIKRYGETPMVVKGTWGHAVIDELSPQPGDMVVEKQRSSAFVGTNLDLLLRSNHIQSVIVTGVVTQGCVMATASSALLHDYYVTVVNDCVASAKKELHDAALMLMKSTLVLEDSVVPSQKIIDTWSAQPVASHRTLTSPIS
jgi:ureidoacrylate peracid hydrolase